MRNSLRKLLKIVFLITIVNAQYIIGQSVDDLQKRLDNPVQTRAGEPDVVDITKDYGGTINLTHPLYVRSGANVRFINGTLSRGALKDSAMLVITNGSTVELGEGAILSGGKQYTGHELVLLETGSLKISAGEIKDCSSNGIITTAPVHYDDAVLVKTPNSSFEMTGGKLSDTGGITNLGGPMTFTNGDLGNGSIRSNTDIFLSGSVVVSSISLLDGAKIRITSTLENDIKILPTPLPSLKLTPALPDDIGDYRGIIVATGENHTITGADFQKLHLSSRLRPENWKLFLKNNNAIIRRVGEIVDAQTLQAYLDDAPAGTENQPTKVEIPAEGIELESPIGIWGNKHILITGGPITVKDLQGADFAFLVTENSSLTFDNILLDGGNYEGQSFFFVRGTLQINNTIGLRNTAGYRYFYWVNEGGVANVYGGEVMGDKHGVYNFGTFNYHGGLFAECDYGIYNGKGGQLTITDGKVHDCTNNIYSLVNFRTKGDPGIPNVWIAKDAHIQMTSAMTAGWEVHFIDNDFNTDTPIIVGDGYTLKSDDASKVKFILPKDYEDYEAYLSAATGAIQIGSGGGSQSIIDTEEKLKQAIENATGTCSGEPTEIKISGEIPIQTIYIKDKSIKLTGGTLKRATNYTDGLFMLENACLTLEDIIIDGNKAAFVNNQNYLWPAFTLDKHARLTINKGTEIRNHRVYNSHMGLIWVSYNNRDECTMVMNGGSIHDNESPLAELITDNGSKYLSFEMNGGTITQNATGYGTINANTFTMSGGTIENNTSNYSYNLTMQTGHIKTGSTIKDGQGGLLIHSNLKLDGDGTSVIDSITLYDPTARISRNGKQKRELVLNHYAYNASKLTAGTVVVAGTDGYQLTADDLYKYMYKNSAWKLELAGNTIVLKESSGQSFGDEDDLQDFLDGLGKSGNAGTEKDPTDVVFSNEAISLSQPLHIPEGTHLLFTGATFVRENTTLKAAGSSDVMLEVPENSSLSLLNVTIDGAKKKVAEALIVIDGQLKIGNDCEIKGGSNKDGLSGAAIYIAPTGTVTMSGGSIFENTGKQGSAVFNEGTFVLTGGTIYNNTSEIGSIVNCEQGSFTMTGGVVRNNKVTTACGGIFIDENSQASFTGGEVSSNEHSDVYSWSNIKLGGNTNVAGSFMIVGPSKLLISSALRHNLKLSYITETPIAGTIVSQGTDGYKLTDRDLAKISCPDEKWEYALNDGNIVLADISTASIVETVTPQKAYMENGHLILNGQKIGETYFIYSADGRLIHTGKIGSDRESYLLNEPGIFIIKCGKNRYKVISNPL